MAHQNAWLVFAEHGEPLIDGDIHGHAMHAHAVKALGLYVGRKGQGLLVCVEIELHRAFPKNVVALRIRKNRQKITGFNRANATHAAVGIIMNAPYRAFRSEIGKWLKPAMNDTQIVGNRCHERSVAPVLLHTVSTIFLAMPSISASVNV